MKPYYQDEAVSLYLGTCMGAAREWWLEADVLVTDPPYGSERASGYGRSALGKRTIANDRSTNARDEVLAAWGERPALVFGHPSIPEPPGMWDYRLVWDKKFPGLGNGPWRWQHESIFVRGPWRGAAPDLSIIRIGRGPQSEARDRHPHQKPTELMARLLGAAPPGVICDPFAGSGSTLVAPKQLGRKAIGVELEERYCEVVARRLAQGVLDFGEPA